MRESKLFNLLKTFQKEEWKRCRKYLISQMSQEAELIYLYDYIMNFRKELNHKKLDQDYANDFLFKNKSNKNFLNLMSKLRGHILDYIGITHMVQDVRELKLHTLQSLNERGLHAEANKVKEEYKLMMDEAPLDIWNSIFSLRMEHTIKFSDNPAKLNDPKGMLDALYDKWLKVTSELSHFYLLDAINISRVYQLDCNEEISNLKNLCSFQSKNTQILRIFQNILLLYEKDDDGAFQKLFSLLNDKTIILSENVGTMVLLYLIQYQLKEIKNGGGSLVMLGRLFDIGLNEGWLFHNGKISDVRFSMMIHTACLNKQFEKASSLIKKWSNTLKDDTRDDTVALAEANIKFYTSSFSESIDLLKSHPFKRFEDRNAARILLLLNYYLYYRDNIEFMTTQIVNYKSFLRRHENKSSKSHFHGALNFVEVLGMLIQNQEVKAVAKRVKELSPLVRRTWIERHLKEKEVMNE